MEIKGNEDTARIEVSLDQVESSHLLSFLFHAKFGDDVRLEIVESPSMRTLLEGLLTARRKLGFDDQNSEQARTIVEDGGLQAPASFHTIENDLKRLLRKEDVSAELAEELFPFVLQASLKKDRFIRPGTRVEISQDGRPAPRSEAQFGIVLRCWQSHIGSPFRCLVAILEDYEAGSVGDPGNVPSLQEFPAALLLA
ncbi:hypothetical protein [Novosphingobium sp.]|uniref:hypothetical protein n=1 Tax=Novosphingobium sp. TaxID=1874826 RepID=UPI0025F1C2A5|nr:hypothetical protein [Novosphingobium sp.]MCC6924312.1 hypothetical protein [Novosphingobium sp.]